MKVKVFIQSAGEFWQHEMLMKFFDGVSDYFKLVEAESSISIDQGDSYSSCDVAVFFGSWKNREKGHHLIRSSIANNSKCFVCLEMPLLARKIREDNKYFRVGVNGFLNNHGTFVENDEEFSSDRLEQLDITWDGWKNIDSGHIVLLLQIPSDASLRGANIFEWARHAIDRIREQTDKKIVIRQHPLAPMRPGEEFYEFYYSSINDKISNIEFSNPLEKTLEQDLAGAYCTVSYTSGSAIDSVINGIPTIACDAGNFAFDISSHYLDDIKNLKMAEPQTVIQWLKKLSYSQWNVEEMRDGRTWQHLLPIVTNTLLTIDQIEIDPKKRKK
jgi:hypothetical protein